MTVYRSFKSIPEPRDVPEEQAKLLLKHAGKKSTKSGRFYAGVTLAGSYVGEASWASGVYGGELYGIFGAEVGGFPGGVLANQIMTPTIRSTVGTLLEPS